MKTERLRASIVSGLPHDVRRALFFVRKNSRFRQLQKLRKTCAGKYSYKPFDDTRSIFVHIPKTAGVSVAHSLYGHLAGAHATVARYQYVFSKRTFDSYFKFTFVRNPWDRAFSAYTFLKSGGFNECDRDWAAANLAEFGSFEQFVHEGLVRRRIRAFTHFVPQTERLFLAGSSVIPMDFLGFYENLEPDFRYVAERLNKPATLPRLNETRRPEAGGYAAHYTASMIDIVEEVYHMDVQTLGYTFDNATLQRQLASR